MIRVGLGLWILFSLDAAMAGWRAAAGRDGRIDKRAYYTRALLEGCAYGQLAFVGPALLGLALARRDPGLAVQEGGERLVLVYASYAILVMIAFAVRWIPNVDLRSTASVFFFAPALIARPAVIVAGMLWAVAAGPSVELAVLAAFSTVVALALPRVLDRRRADRADFR